VSISLKITLCKETQEKKHILENIIRRAKGDKFRKKRREDQSIKLSGQNK
jgi:hypothetical protein